MAVICVDEYEVWVLWLQGIWQQAEKLSKTEFRFYLYVYFLTKVAQEAPRCTSFMKNASLPKWIPQPLTSFKPALRPWDLEIYVFGRLKWVDVPRGIAPYVKRMLQIGRLLQVLAKNCPQTVRYLSDFLLRLLLPEVVMSRDCKYSHYSDKMKTSGGFFKLLPLLWRKISQLLYWVFLFVLAN